MSGFEMSFIVIDEAKDISKRTWRIIKSFAKTVKRCKNCNKIISIKEYIARDGLCQECWAQHNVPKDNSYWMHPYPTR